MTKFRCVKRINLFLIVFLFFSYVVTAQEIGLRFGDMTGNNVAIDGVITFETGRLHSNISFGNTVGIDVVYDFVFLPINNNDNLYYYLGIGLTTVFGSDFKFGGVGEVGIEYRFSNSPVALGLDYKPAVLILEKTDFIWSNFGFNIRYIFNN
jgi:hypothetical protein